MLSYNSSTYHLFSSTFPNEEGCSSLYVLYLLHAIIIAMMTTTVVTTINIISVECSTPVLNWGITGDKNSASFSPPCINTSGTPTNPPMIENTASTINGTVIAD